MKEQSLSVYARLQCLKGTNLRACFSPGWPREAGFVIGSPSQVLNDSLVAADEHGWALIHMIEDSARRCRSHGHLAGAIDGATGDHLPGRAW
jgi:hypothetical protein